MTKKKNERERRELLLQFTFLKPASNYKVQGYIQLIVAFWSLSDEN